MVSVTKLDKLLYPPNHNQDNKAKQWKILADVFEKIADDRIPNVNLGYLLFHLIDMMQCPPTVANATLNSESFSRLNLALLEIYHSETGSFDERILWQI